MGAVTIVPLTLTGVSKYSTDMQAILNRAVQIGQLPITQLQNKDGDVIQQKNLLAGIESATAGFANSLTALGTIAQSQAVSATSSNPASVTVVATGTSLPGTYTVNSITSVASAAAERSSNHFLDSTSTPVSSTGTLNLVVGSNQFQFSLTNNSLVGLRDKINTLGAGVTASILTTSGGNYLSVSSNTTGASTLQLFDDPLGANSSLLTSTNQGANAVFRLNGIDVNQAGNVVNNIIPGLTFTIRGASASPTTLTLASDGTQLASSLQGFVDNYNSLAKALAAQVGPSAGLLTGDSAVTQIQGLLRQITSYHTGAGSINALSDLGIEFASTGVASFNQATFSKLSGAQLSDAFSYLGSTTKGLAAFARNLQQYSDPVTGFVRAEQNGLDTIDKHLQSQIATRTDRLNFMQTSLAARLQAADATIALLTSQQNTITASLQSLSFVLYGKSVG